MPIAVDHIGRLAVTEHPATRGLAGRVFARREQQDDAADLVTVLGATDVGGAAGPEVELVVSCAAFGAVPPGWDAATVTYNLDAFASEYREVSDAERASLALSQAAEAKSAAEASAHRE
jgi:hypothetical protein